MYFPDNILEYLRTTDHCGQWTSDIKVHEATVKIELPVYATNVNLKRTIYSWTIIAENLRLAFGDVKRSDEISRT